MSSSPAMEPTAPGKTAESHVHKRKKTIEAPEGLYQQLLGNGLINQSNQPLGSFLNFDADGATKETEETDLSSLLNRRMSRLVDTVGELSTDNEQKESDTESNDADGRDLPPSHTSPVSTQTTAKGSIRKREGSEKEAKHGRRSREGSKKEIEESEPLGEQRRELREIFNSFVEKSSDMAEKHASLLPASKLVDVLTSTLSMNMPSIKTAASVLDKMHVTESAEKNVKKMESVSQLAEAMSDGEKEAQASQVIHLGVEFLKNIHSRNPSRAPSRAGSRRNSLDNSDSVCATATATKTEAAAKTSLPPKLARQKSLPPTRVISSLRLGEDLSFEDFEQIRNSLLAEDGPVAHKLVENIPASVLTKKIDLAKAKPEAREQRKLRQTSSKNEVPENKKKSNGQEDQHEPLPAPALRKSAFAQSRSSTIGNIFKSLVSPGAPAADGNTLRPRDRKKSHKVKMPRSLASPATSAKSSAKHSKSSSVGRQSFTKPRSTSVTPHHQRHTSTSSLHSKGDSFPTLSQVFSHHKPSETEPEHKSLSSPSNLLVSPVRKFVRRHSSPGLSPDSEARIAESTHPAPISDILRGFSTRLLTSNEKSPPAVESSSPSGPAFIRSRTGPMATPGKAEDEKLDQPDADASGWEDIRDRMMKPVERIQDMQSSAQTFNNQFSFVVQQMQETLAETGDRIEYRAGLRWQQSIHYVTDRCMAALHICIVVVLIPLIVGVTFISAKIPLVWPDSIYNFTIVWLSLSAIVTCCFCCLYGFNDYFAMPEGVEEVDEKQQESIESRGDSVEESAVLEDILESPRRNAKGRVLNEWPMLAPAGEFEQSQLSKRERCSNSDKLNNPELSSKTALPTSESQLRIYVEEAPTRQQSTDSVVVP